MSTHDQEPRTKRDQDLSPEELAFLHAAPSHDRTTGNGNRRRNLLIGLGGSAASAAALVALYLGFNGGENEPAGKNDRVDAGTSQTAEPTPDVQPTPTPEPAPEVLPIPELEPPTSVTVEQYPNAADAAVALQDQLEEYINSGTYSYDLDDYVPGNPEYRDIVFGDGPHSERMKKIINETYPMYTDYASGTRGSLTPEFIDQTKYLLKLNSKDVEVISQNGNSAIVRMTVNASDNLIELREEEHYNSFSGQPTVPEFKPSEEDVLPSTMSEWVRAEYELRNVDGSWTIVNMEPVN